MTPCTIDDVKSYDSPKIYKRHDGLEMQCQVL